MSGVEWMGARRADEMCRRCEVGTGSLVRSAPGVHMTLDDGPQVSVHHKTFLFASETGSGQAFLSMGLRCGRDRYPVLRHSLSAIVQNQHHQKHSEQASNTETQHQRIPYSLTTAKQTFYSRRVSRARRLTCPFNHAPSPHQESSLAGPSRGRCALRVVRRRDCLASEARLQHHHC